MKKTLLIFFLIYGTLVFAQGRFCGYVVTNANDTIKCTFSLEMNIFNDSIFYDSGISKRAKIFLKDGSKVKYKPNELKTIFITGPKQGNYKFVSLQSDNYESFYHEKIVGKLSYYILYRINTTGGFPNQSEFVVKNNEMIILNDMTLRKKFGKLIEDYPELHAKWMDSNNHFKLNQIQEVITLYNNNFKYN